MIGPDGRGEWMMPNQAKTPARTRVAAAGFGLALDQVSQDRAPEQLVTMNPPERIVTVAIHCWVSGLSSPNGLPISGSTWLA